VLHTVPSPSHLYQVLFPPPVLFSPLASLSLHPHSVTVTLNPVSFFIKMSKPELGENATQIWARQHPRDYLVVVET